MSFDLTKYIKYCLGYVKLTSQNIIFLQKKYSVELSSQYFNLLGLLNIDLDGNPGEIINLSTFYSYDTKAVPEGLKPVFEKEKEVQISLKIFTTNKGMILIPNKLFLILDILSSKFQQ